MNYQNVLLKDKSDVTEEVTNALPNVNVLGARQKPTLDKSKIRVLSVKSSRVGKKTLTDYPNLEWIICRSHGVDNINISEVSKKGVGVVSTNPTANSCAEWIFDKISEDNGIVIFGNGSISKRLQDKITDFFVVDTKTSKEEISAQLKECKTLVSTIPLNEYTKGYFNFSLLSKIDNPFNLISISRGGVFDNHSLISLCERGQILEGHLDIISPKERDRLLSFSQISYYHHSSWSFSEKDNESEEYAKSLKEVIDNCLSNTVNNAHLRYSKPNEDTWFE